MLAYYFKIAWRNLWKHKVFSAVNICGLAIGLAAFWLIALYVAHELSYDRYHIDADKIYRVASHATWNGGNFDITGTSAPVIPMLKKEFPQIVSGVRIDPEGGGRISVANKSFEENALLIADQSLFDVFSYKFLYGDKQTALYKPQSLVLTKTLAAKLFGDPANAIGKAVTINGDKLHLVTAIIEDVRDNSHFNFLGVRSFPQGFSEGWEQLHLYSYIRLAKNADVKKIEARLPDFVNRHMKPLMDALGTKDSKIWFELQPLTSIHLQSDLMAELGPNGKMSTIYIFSAIGFLILIIAAINYMNLSTARASVRVREVGVRKIAGSGKGQLVWMFLAEAVLLSFMAMILALLVLYGVMPLFQQLTDKSISIWYFGATNTLLVLFLFSLLTGLISGFYPALFLSGFRLIPALKGQIGSQSGNVIFRKSLVTFQFFITILMISGSIVVYQQLRYVLSKDLGFNKDQVLGFQFKNDTSGDRIPALKNELKRNPSIENVASSTGGVGKNLVNLEVYNAEFQGIVEEKTRMAHYMEIDDDFLNTMQMKLVAGRNFSKDIPADKTSSVIVNEALIRDAGWKDGIGKRIRLDTSFVSIIGVVKDFHFFSLQHKIEPLIMPLDTSRNESRSVYVRVSKENIPKAIKSIEKAYKNFDNATPFNYSFLDKNFAQQYESEQRQANILLTFTILTVLIACLGLFGLVTFMIEQRFKEIGIRKVLGATVTSIVRLISRDFMRLIFVAALIASPLAWWMMNSWLQGFAYRITISWVIFLIAGLAAVLIAMVTIGYKSVGAAVANPVKSLRSE